MKGIGIILVDIGHNGVANENYIYLFHRPIWLYATLPVLENTERRFWRGGVLEPVGAIGMVSGTLCDLLLFVTASLAGWIRGKLQRAKEKTI